MIGFRINCIRLNIEVDQWSWNFIIYLKSDFWLLECIYNTGLKGKKKNNGFIGEKRKKIWDNNFCQTLFLKNNSFKCIWVHSKTSNTHERISFFKKVWSMLFC